MVVPVRLYPGAAGEAALRDTLTLCNQVAGLVSARAFGMRVTSKLEAAGEGRVHAGRIPGGRRPALR